MAPNTPGKMLADNIAAAMGLRRLSQTDLAERMKALGYGKWSRQTVAEIVKYNRRLLAEELYGLGVALEIPVTTLVIPWADASDPEVMLPSGLVLIYSAQFRISNVPAFPIMWEDNKPKFTPADTIREQAHSMSHPGGPGRPGDA